MSVSLGATEDQLRAAIRSTYGKLGRWARARSIRGLSAKLAIQQKILRSRFKTFRISGGAGSAGEGAKVWYGLRPIPLSRLHPRRVAGGIRADGGRFVEGAFEVSLRGGKQIVKRAGKARLPLVIQYADIAEESQIYIEDEVIGDEFDAQFYKLLEHELKWRTQILK